MQKSVIFQAVSESKNHPTAEEIYERVSVRYPSISIATVYRNLNQLAEDGLIGRVKIPDGADRFDKATQKHDHFICRKCGRVYDFRSKSVVSVIPDEGMSDNGFEVTDYSLTFSGICPECKK